MSHEIFSLEDGFVIYTPVTAELLQTRALVLVNVTDFANGIGQLPEPTTCRRIDLVVDGVRNITPGLPEAPAAALKQLIAMLENNTLEGVVVTGLNFNPMQYILDDDFVAEDGSIIQWQKDDLRKLEKLFDRRYPQ